MSNPLPATREQLDRLDVLHTRGHGVPLPTADREEIDTREAADLLDYLEGAFPDPAPLAQPVRGPLRDVW